MKEIKGSLDGKAKKIGIVVSKFNEFISRELLRGSVDELKLLGVNDEDIEVYWVEGAFEIPVALKNITQRKTFDGLIALGVVLRGETTHFEYIARSVTSGISNIMLTTGIPVSLGVITPDDLEQAIERAGGKAGNKGREAARTVISMINLIEKI